MKYKNYKEVSTSIRNITNKVLTQDDLAKRIIIQKGSTYQAYGDYIIEENQFGWQVTSELCNHPILFCTAKVALAWCILYKTSHTEQVLQLEWLDSRVAAKQFDIDVLTYTLEQATETTNTAILLARLTEDISARQSYKKQLGKLVETAKYIKLKGTHDELRRFNKTSRRGRSR